MKRFAEAIGERKLILGVVHLKPLPGSPRYDGREIASIVSAARGEAETILEAGFDGYILENFGDTPFFKLRVPPHVLTIMTRIATELPRGEALVGVNVLRNDAGGALAIAAACGLDMIRINVHSGAMVTDQGVVEGDAAGTLRAREQLSPEVAILADINVKHAAPLASVFDLRDTARDTAYRGLADGLIATGNATGRPCAPGDLMAVRGAVPDRPLLAGSGVNAESVRDTLLEADGVIVGTWIKERGQVEQPVDRGRAREFIKEARGP